MSSQDAGRRMPGPKPGKSPMKANIFRMTQGANSQLLPLFPYHGPGDIVPTLTARRTKGGENLGYFLHRNDVDEIMICFGATGRLRPGDVRVGAREHGVGGALGNDPDNFALNCVTQRQLEQGPQRERVTLVCEKCSTELFSHDFSALPEGTAEAVHYAPLATISGTVEAFELYEQNEAQRTCSACGHISPPFPIHLWGWSDYVRKSGIAEDASRQLAGEVVR